ncbi:MAG: hypothetical protein AAGI01_04790, partial [Myxococcota bacterium]
CDAHTNVDVATSEATGQSLAALGDVFSVQGFFNLDEDLGTNINEREHYYSFEVTETGSTVSELSVSVAYGCGVNSTSLARPSFSIVDNTGSTVASTFGDVNWSSTGLFFGSATFDAKTAGPAGANTYHLVVNNGTDTNGCSDFVAYVELTGNTVPAECLNAGPTSSVVPNTTKAMDFNSDGTALAGIELTDSALIDQSALTLTATTGTGALVPNSLKRAGNRSYTVEISGTAEGDSYTIDVAGSTDTCSTVLTGGSTSYTVRRGEVVADAMNRGTCPLPGVYDQHYSAPDACNEQTNSSVTLAADTRFTLAALGDRFSISGTYDSDGSDNDFFAFNVEGDGSDYYLAVRTAYGCDFQGAGGRSNSSVFKVDIGTGSMNAAGSSVGTFTNRLNGVDDYLSVDNTTEYGAGTSLVTLPAASIPAGQNTRLFVRLDDGTGTNWCMDYIVYVDLFQIGGTAPTMIP